MDDEMTELYDARIPRVDLVDKAANGTRFLIAKNGEGLVDADTVRELIGKSADTPPAPAPAPDHVTLSGSPAAIMRMMHQAAVAKSSDTTTDVSKELDMSDELDASTVMAEPEDNLPGSETDPGSPAWEAVDAATACKWTAILARAKGALGLLAEREMLEAASTNGTPDDAEHAYDLQDAQCAIDYAISVLAPFAVDEHAEAESGAEQMSMVGKALAGYDPAGLDVIETLGHVRKAGRVLSTANEAAIRGAVEQLQKVLASLPQAPVADEQTMTKTEEGTVPEQTETVTKTEDAPAEETVTKTEGAPAAAQGAPAVTKADGEGKTPQVAVYDSKGNLVGIVDPADVTPISGADKADDGDEVVADTEGDATPEGAETETPDLMPAPAGTVGTPADEVAKGAPAAIETSDDTPTDTPDVLKSNAETVAKAEIESRIAGQEETIAKQAAALTQATDLIETLKGRVEALEKQPAESKVFANGVAPSPVTRGQDEGAAPIDVAKGREMKTALYKSTNATEQNKIAQDMQALAVARLQQIHGRPSA